MKLWPHFDVLAGSLALLMLSVAVPCVPAAPPTPEPADAGVLRAPEPNPKRGGVLKWGGLANSTLYDLHQTGTIANMGPQAPMYDLLVQVDPVHWDKVIPDLAQSWTISEDGLTYTFSLREGVKFHDGAPLTAEDVVASFHHIISPPAGVLSPRQGLFDAVKEVVATGPLTVEFRLTEPRGFFVRALEKAPGLGEAELHGERTCRHHLLDRVEEPLPGAEYPRRRGDDMMEAGHHVLGSQGRPVVELHPLA